MGQPGAILLAGPLMPIGRGGAMSVDSRRQRVQLDFSQEAYDRLTEIKKLADARTNAEVVRDALRLYEWFLRRKREGYAVQLTKDDAVKEVELVI